jgi:hypothetical protein
MWILDDHHLYVTYKSNTSMGTVESRAFLGYDPSSRKYHMHWFDNLGASTLYTGDFDADGSLVLTGEAATPTGSTREQITFRRVPEGGFKAEARAAGPDGAWTPTFDSVATAYVAR